MTDKTALAQERTQLFSDVLEGRIPKRVPVYGFIQNEFAIQYAGYDLTVAQWDSDLFEVVVDKICQDFFTDNVPVMTVRYPSIYRLLGSRNWIMGSGGLIQHPEVEGLKQEEYDEFIASPFDCIVNKVLPRLYSELDTTDSASKAIALAKGFKCFNDEFGNQFAQAARLKEKYGFADANLFGTICESPLDFLTDQMRGFKGISLDIRRIPDKVEAAVNAVTPWVIKMGMQPFPAKNTCTFIPLHMAPFMREKDFARLWWPGFKKQVYALREAGFQSFIYCEQDWTRYVDYLAELPERTVLFFEDGDPKKIKEKLGEKHVITGFYPQTLLKTGTKQQCIDKAKELVDILAPGGGYIFNMDKVLITANSVKPENLQAVYEYVATNTNY